MTEPSAPPLSLKRRKALKLLGSAALTAAVGPWIRPRSAFAQTSGEVNVLTWSNYCPPGFVKAFQEASGITLNLITVNSDQEVFERMQETRGRGIDVCSPSHMLSIQWETVGLLQPIDYTRLPNIQNLNPNMLSVGDSDWNFGENGPHWIPHIWGTEGIAWRHDLWEPDAAQIKDATGTTRPQPSYGDLWRPDLQGQVMMRPFSGMVGTGLYLEQTGELSPGDMAYSYNDEKIMRPIWDKLTTYCIRNKQQFKRFWTDTPSLKAGFAQEEIILGQVWDGPVLTQAFEGLPLTYRAPIEGALAWVRGLSLSAYAENEEQAYAFLDFCCDPEMAGRSIDGGDVADWGMHGYNSAVLGADQFTTESYGKRFDQVFPGKSLYQVWPWPREPQWFAAARAEYLARFMAA